MKIFSKYFYYLIQAWEFSNFVKINKWLNLFVYIFLFDLNNCLILEDNEPNHDDNINKNSTCIFKLADSSKDERTINCLSSAASIKSN